MGANSIKYQLRDTNNRLVDEGNKNSSLPNMININGVCYLLHAVKWLSIEAVWCGTYFKM